MWERDRDFTDEERKTALAHIYGQVASGRALSTVLREDGGEVDLPSSSTFWRWHMDDVDIRDNLARARLNGVEALLEEAMEIADTPKTGLIVTSKQDKDGNEIEETRREDMLGHRKLQVETRVKRAQMINPRKYGPRLDLTSDGERVVMDDVSRAARFASIMAGIEKRREAEDGDDERAD